MITQLHWELSVLSRAVAYNNLSGAALHVGLSQPQLSRIVSRIEGELKVNLLDRSARRKSGWTPAAFRLAELYSSNSRRLEGEIQKLIEAAEPKQFKLATLEGIVPLASRFCHRLLREVKALVVELDVHDLNRLEELFMSGDLDMIFTSREPGKKKFKYSLEVGYQSIENMGGKGGIPVLSSFEFGTQAGEKPPKSGILVSNSLEVRRHWIKSHGGHGSFPSEIRAQKSVQGSNAVYLIGADHFSLPMWTRISKLCGEIWS